MKGRKRISALLAAALLFLTSCGGGAETAAGDAAMGGSPSSSAPASELPMDMEYSKTEEYVDFLSDSSVYRNSGAKLIRRAELTIQTTEFDQAVEKLDQMVLEYEGYFETASVFGGSYRDAHANRSGEYVVRIPGERYTEFLSSVGDLGYVTRSSKSSEDVGERYYDTESRLKTQRTKQERLLNLLEQAATMEDIIDLENALSEVEYEIEQLSSTLNRYDALISYSTISIYLNEVTKVTEEVGETSSLWQRITAGFASSGSGLVEGVQNMLVWLSYHIFELGVLAVAALAGVTVGRRTWKKRKGKLAPKAKEE